MRALIISTEYSERRRVALAALLDPHAPSIVDGSQPLPSLDDVEHIVVDGPPPSLPAADLQAIAARVERGASLVAIAAAPTERGGFWASLLGVTALEPLSEGEYFASVGSRLTHLTSRLQAEFPVVDRFVPLRAEDGTAEILLSVNVGFSDLPAVVERRVGRGLVITSGLGSDERAVRHPEIVRLLRRALRPGSSVDPGGRNYGIGIVGYGPFGGMGFYHGLAAQATPGLEFVAVCDSNGERRKAAEAEFPGVAAYADIDEMAADDDVEVVIVATPPVYHADLSLQLLRAGKHVACEKPLCLTVAEADELITTARNADRVLTVNQNRRWDPDFLAIRRAVGDGLIGDLFSVETFVGGFDHPCRAWHSEVSVSGGAVYDWGSHHVDWILQLMGTAPSRVIATGHKRVWHDVTNLDQLRVRMLWDDGREAEFLQSDIMAIRRPKFFVQGTGGTLVGHYRPVTFERIEPGRGYVAEAAHHAEAPADLTLSRYESGYGLTEMRIPSAGEQRFAFHRNLADHLHLGEPLAVTPESVRSVIAVLEAAAHSADDGGAVVTPEA